jgi:site-specific recombinase XerD
MIRHHVSPHMILHIIATRLRSQGADLQIVQLLLGHADIKTTTIYSHLVTVTQRGELTRWLAEPTARIAGSSLVSS